MAHIPNPLDFGIDVKRYFHEGQAGQAPGSFWSLWGGFVSAHHVYTQQFRKTPPFASSQVLIADGLIDACLYGCNLSQSQRPRSPVEEERVFVYGFPGGSNTLSKRIGRVYLKRSAPPAGAGGYSMPSWIGKIDELPEDIPRDHDEANHYEPVFVGMSGGLVMTEDGTALGILVGRSGPMDMDFDGDLDQLFEFVELGDVWDIFHNAQPFTAASTRVRVDRVVSNHDVTISRVYINDNLICHGLEDE
ncbi:MAG: hypothetical protein ACPGVT_08875, partial [Maricaulaceae bacterium]